MQEKQWFEEWFNSPYYHLLYNNRSEEEAEKFITAVVQKLGIPQQASVLDIACGKGRHSRTLAKLGLNVTGIDLSENSINYAKQFESDHLHFDVWDMRTVYKPNAFDYEFNLFSSFGYFSDTRDDNKALKAFAGNLKPGGTVLIDYINSECAVKNMKTRDIVQRGDIQFHIQKRIEKGFIRKRIEFLANGEDHTYEEQLEVINLLHFTEMLKDAGFELTQTFGDYDLSPYTPGTSMRLILVAKKITPPNLP